MGIPLDYKDPIQIVKAGVRSDGYATEVIEQIVDVMGLFVHNTGWQHGSNQSAITSDAQVYLDPSNEFVIENYNRLEGMYIIANLYGEAETQAWYKITTVTVGEDKLLGNTIDNVNCELKKASEIPHVS